MKIQELGSRCCWRCDHSGMSLSGGMAHAQGVNLFKILSVTADTGLVVRSNEKCAFQFCSWRWWCISFMSYCCGILGGHYALKLTKKINKNLK